LHGAEGNSGRSGMRGIGHGHQEEQQESQSAREREGTPGAQRNTRAYLAACVQNGGASGSSGTECAIVKCVQIKLSSNSRHNATLGRRRKRIYPFAAFELEFELRRP
jgi:hypothetical protein